MTIQFTPPPTYAEVVLVDEKTEKARFNPIWLKWFVDVAAFITSSGGGSGTTQHNSLGGLQGGTANQYYHLTSAQRSAVASGITVTITTAKLTGAGTNGSMTFTNGILTAQTAAT